MVKNQYSVKRKDDFKKRMSVKISWKDRSKVLLLFDFYVIQINWKYFVSSILIFKEYKKNEPGVVMEIPEDKLLEI